jgi:hypothetical protein
MVITWQMDLTNVYRHQSELVVLNQKDMQDLLVKDGFAKMDLSCLPITDRTR